MQIQLLLLLKKEILIKCSILILYFNIIFYTFYIDKFFKINIILYKILISFKLEL